MHTPVCTASVLWMSTGAGYFIYLSDLQLDRQTFLSEYEQGWHHQLTEESPTPPIRHPIETIQEAKVAPQRHADPSHSQGQSTKWQYAGDTVPKA